MAQRITARTEQELNNQAISFLDARCAHLQKLAIRYEIDFDELYQESALFLLQLIRCLPTNVRDIPGYLYVRMRCHVLDLVTERTKKTSVSFDEVLSADSDISLLDVLPSPDDMPVDHTHTDARAVALYAALRQLPLEEQVYLRRVYKLNAYNVLPPAGSKPDYNRSDNACRQHAYKQLRRNADLAKAVGVL
jgi:hypothetical protein